MCAKCAEIYIYVFHQRVGGPICLRSTEAIARVFMDRRLKKKLVDDKINTKLDARYVDDG